MKIKNQKTKLVCFWKLSLLVAPMLLFLFTGPLQISCGSNSLTEVSPESIPAPIAKTTIDLGIDSTSLSIEASSTSGVLVDLSGEILGSGEATVALVKNGVFYKFVPTIDRRFSFPIATADLDVDFSIVVLVSGSTEEDAIANGVSEPVGATVFEEAGAYALRVAVTSMDDPDVPNVLDEPPLLVNQKIYVSAADEEGQPLLSVIDLEQGAWPETLTDDFDNPPVLLRYKAPNSIIAIDRGTGLAYDIAIDGSEVVQETSSANIAMPRYYTIAPDVLWRVTVQRNPDSTSQFLFLSRLNELISEDLPVAGELNIALLQCEIINADTTNEVDILVTKAFTDGSYALQLYEVTTLPTSNLETQAIVPTTILNTTNQIRDMDIEPETRQEALFICTNDAGVKNICLYNVNTRTTSPLLNIDGVNIPRAVYTTDQNIVYETCTDCTVPSENKIFLFDRTTNTSRFLTRGFLPSASPTNPGVIVHLLVDSQNNFQVGVHNLNNL